MAQLVGQLLEMVWFKSTRIRNDVIMNRSNCSLSYTLRHQEEIIILRSRHFRVYNCTRQRVGNATLCFCKQPGGTTLLDNNHREASDVRVKLRYGLSQLTDFSGLAISQLKRNKVSSIVNHTVLLHIRHQINLDHHSCSKFSYLLIYT